MIARGQKIPAFLVSANDGASVAVPSGTPMVVYFYPKDDTPGCTTEAKEFTDRKDAFDALGVSILGISPDPVTKHEKFIAKHDLDIRLGADEDHSAAEAFGVWVEKSMYGKTYMGIERSTFLIADDGTVLEEWRKVKVKGHVDVVLEAAKQHFG